MTQLIFEEINNNVTGITEVVFEHIRRWDYIPSPCCIRDTFDVSYTAAYKLWLQIMKEKMKDEHYKKQHYPRRQEYPAFRNILRTLWLLRNLASLNVWKQITK